MNRRLLLIVVSVICVFSTQAQNNRDIYLNMDASQHERILDLLSKLLKKKFHYYVPLHRVFPGLT